jgi:hypothetical protein
MKKWHFDHTNSHIKALDDAYVRIKKLEVEKEDKERDEKEEQNAK